MTRVALGRDMSARSGDPKVHVLALMRRLEEAERLHPSSDSLSCHRRSDASTRAWCSLLGCFGQVEFLYWFFAKQIISYYGRNEASCVVWGVALFNLGLPLLLASSPHLGILPRVFPKRGEMQRTPLATENGPLASAFGEIVHRGWLNLKTRSMVNVRPRHMRYCILARDSRLLSTFKFQPSAGDLTSGSVKPLRSYKVLGVAPWDGRRFAFLVSVVQQADNADRVLEIDAQTAPDSSDWIRFLRVVSNDNNDEGWPAPAPASAPASTQPQQQQQPTLDKPGELFGSPGGPAAALHTTKTSDLWVKGASVHRGLLNAAGARATHASHSLPYY